MRIAAIARVGTIVVLTATLSGSGQFDAPGEYRSDLAYDGRFTFVRLRWAATKKRSLKGVFLRVVAAVGSSATKMPRRSGTSACRKRVVQLAAQKP